MGACGSLACRSNASRATKVISGEFRAGFPRVSLTLPGAFGSIEVEFVIDTGFDGEMALPEGIVSHLALSAKDTRYVELAGGFRQRCYAYDLLLDWNGEMRSIEVLTLDGNPLLGNDFWKGLSLLVENREGDEVVFEMD